MTFAVICVSATWFTANEVLVRPRDFEIHRQTKDIVVLQEEVRELRVRLANTNEDEVSDLKAQLAT